MINNYSSLKERIYEDLKLDPIIPTSDSMAIKLYPEYEKFYNKKFLCQIQNIKHGFKKPKFFPVVIKPYINLEGGSLGFSIIKNEKKFKLKKGQFWMEYLIGEHLCIDIFVLKGKIVLYTILESFSDKGGTFIYHESKPNYKLNNKLKDLIEKNFKNYSGTLNCETINNIIIDFHLRLNGDFYLYNNTVVKEIENLYFNKKWNLKNYKVPKMYLFPIFIEKNKSYEIKLDIIEKILIKYNCDNLMYKYKMSSPGGERVLMYSSNTYSDGMNARKEIFKSITYYNLNTKLLFIFLLFIVILIIKFNG